MFVPHDLLVLKCTNLHINEQRPNNNWSGQAVCFLGFIFLLSAIVLRIRTFQCAWMPPGETGYRPLRLIPGVLLLLLWLSLFLVVLVCNCSDASDQCLFGSNCAH